MRLPNNLPQTVLATQTLALHGISRDFTDATDLNDAVNLTGTPLCQTREARAAALLLTEQPDQIIPVGERLFFRYGNTLQEMSASDGGDLVTLGSPLSLSALQPAPDRFLIHEENRLSVLPDGIYFTDEAPTWQIFGAGYDIKTAIPFTDARTLFYTSGYSGEIACNEAYLLKAGMLFSFSWLAGQTFRVVAVDRAYSDSGNGDVFEGYRVTLDRNVTGWKSMPTGAKLSYAMPTAGPLLPTIQIGRFEEIDFYEDRMRFYSTHPTYTYTYQHSELLHPGQLVQISGSGAAQNNRTITVTEIGENYITFSETLFPITEAAGTTITITPLLPNFRYLQPWEDRLVGVTEEQTLWVSRKGEPFVFHQSPITGEDAWSIRLPAPVTGMTLWKDSLLCFTETGGFRLFGADALHYGITGISVSGIAKQSEGSLAQLADTLYYASPLGIMRYAGGSDRCISKALPTALWVQSAAALDGSYYVLADQRLWCYDTERAAWWSQNAETVTGIFSAFHNLYLITPSAVYRSKGGTAGVDWSLRTATLPKNTSEQIVPHHCRLLLESEAGCALTILFRPYGTHRWEPLVTRSVKGERCLKERLPHATCNGFSLKLEGCGSVILHDLSITYRRLS